MLSFQKKIKIPKMTAVSKINNKYFQSKHISPKQTKQIKQTLQ